MNVRSLSQKLRRNQHGQAISEFQVVLFGIALIVYFAIVGDFGASDESSLVDTLYERQESFTHKISEP